MTFLFFLVMLACGGQPPKEARQTISAVAHAVRAVDVIAAREYENAANEALQESTTMQEYRAKLKPYDRVERALRMVRSTLIVTERTLDAWRDSDGHEFAAMAPCLLAALGELAYAIDAADMELPKALGRALELGQKYVGECHEP